MKQDPLKIAFAAALISMTTLVAIAQDGPQIIKGVENDLTHAKMMMLADTLEYVHETTRWFLRNPEITMHEHSVFPNDKVDLAVLTIEDLGFHGAGFPDAAMNWPTYEEILRAASDRGYSFCPPWVGPKLLLDGGLPRDTLYIVGTALMSNGFSGSLWAIALGGIDAIDVGHPRNDGTWSYRQYKFPFNMMDGTKHHFIFVKPDED